MKDISIFFEPGFIPEFRSESIIQGTLSAHTVFHRSGDFPDLNGMDIAIIGVMEERNSYANKGCSKAPDEVRKFLYELSPAGHDYKIADLGNIKAGATIEDTWYAVSQSVAFLIKRNILPIIIGGSQDITFANYLAYEKLEQTINMVTIDSRINLGDVEDQISSRTFLGKIIMHQPNYLFNYCNVALQSHFADARSLELMDKLYFDNYRLGELRKDITACEPLIRNADILSFDLSAIRHADAPGNAESGPNGLFGEEACQLCRYAGMSDKLTSAGFYELNPARDSHGQTTHLVAQMIWYLVDGYYNRKKDFPIGDRSLFTKYRVTSPQFDHEILFFKSNRSDRWWMDVPYPPDKRLKFERHHMVPCSYQDYLQASEGEMPDLWWRTYQKLS
ncbi:MAG TPA: formimidoylglutamase [Flavobacteriales bacterium]|nr:formimidoylglutamase [Flavobacteriales bacterium]HRE97693.1 formimidoylglutamase [Flavobacteriales bacterium]HRJ35026.1 formimidoylglutamase [Flavobacteriales bacterium]HRJ38348.1 formimidoylglutamase [Flavobacteriales bacterium]